MKIQNNFYRLEVSKIKVRDIVNLVISIIGIFTITIQIIEIKRNAISEELNLKLIIYTIIICIVMILINIYSILNKREAVMNKKDIEKLQIENKSLTEVNDKVRCFKHDFNNIVQAIDGYIVLDDMDSLQVYFNSLVNECNCVNIVEHINCKAKSNPAICSVLLNKFKLAEKNDIKMNIEILVDLAKITKKSYTISRMLGILLDNALEASKECEEKIINVQFLKQEERGRTLIIVENTYNNKEVDTNKIFDKNYTTKGAKGNSGLGLWKIRDILSKDTNLDLFTTKDDKMFKQQLEIYG
jgi:two-component system sensor histidine kinase AgrC